MIVVEKDAHSVVIYHDHGEQGLSAAGVSGGGVADDQAALLAVADDQAALLAVGVADGQAAGSPATAAATFGYTATAPANSEPKSAGTISTSRPGIGAWSIFPPPR
jgi:hypothetical protein